MNKLLKNRLLITYLPIFFVSLFLLSSCFYLFVNHLTHKQTKQANSLLVDQVMLKQDQTLKQIEAMISNEIQYNEQLLGFFDRDREDLYAYIAEPSKKLQEVISRSPDIDSIYLFRKDAEKVLTQNHVTDLDRFGDQEFIRQVLAQGGPPRWLAARPYREFPEDPPRQVISLVRKVPLLSGDKGFAVIQISTETLANDIMEMSRNPLSELVVTDQSGAGLVKSGERNLVSHLASHRSAYTGWTYDIYLKDAGFFEVFSSLHFMWAMAMLILVFLCILWIVYVSRHKYKPIEAVMDQIGALEWSGKPGIGKPGKDEFQFIHTAVTKLIEQSNEYQEKHKTDLVYRKRLLFMELLEGMAPVRGGEWLEEAAELNVPSGFRSISAAVIEIDRYTEFAEKYPYRDQLLFKFVIKNVAEETASQYEVGIWQEWVENDRLAVLLLAPGGKEERLGSFFQELVLWIDQHLHFTVTIGSGTSVEHYEEVSLSYGEAVQALKYKSVLGGSRSIRFEEIRTSSGHRLYELMHDIRQIVLLFVQGDAAWETGFNRFFQRLKEEMLSIDDIVVAMNYLNYYFNQSLKELAPEYTGPWHKHVHPSLVEVLNAFETLDEVYSRYSVLLQEVYGHIKEERQKREAYSLVKEIQQFINDNYANPDLSLAMIGDRFDVNIKSLSQMFKEELGEKFVDYLAALRVGHARRMLEETAVPIQEIAVRVGYLHVHSFTRVFKKWMNQTPGDYRKQYSAGSPSNP